MSTIPFDTEKAKRIELAVCSEFGNSLSEIVSFRDTIFKKAVVFILSKYFDCDKRILGHKYQMTYLYVPTVVNEVEFLIKTVPSFDSKINAVLNRIRNEKKLDTAGIRNFAAALS